MSPIESSSSSAAPPPHSPPAADLSPANGSAGSSFDSVGAPATVPRHGRLDLGCHSCHVTRRNDVRRSLFAAANRVQEEVVRLQGGLARIRHLHGPTEVDCGEDEAVALCIGRDSAPWIEAFIEHHLTLGVRHIFYLDNGSEDGTVALASRHDRVTVFATDISFNRYEVGLRRWITRRFGRDRWSLYCDVDELFDYPASDRLPLAGLLRYMRAHGYKALTAQMLDLFSDKTFRQLAEAPPAALKEEYRYYDLADLVPTRDVYWIRDGQVANEEITCLFGGIRKRVFGDGCLLLTKHPLVYADDSVGVYTYDGHFMTAAAVADISAVLLHYKYVGSLPDRARREVAQDWHNKAGALYGGLSSVLSDNPDLCLRQPTSARLERLDELVDRGLLVVTDRYERWVEQHGG